MVEVVKIPKVKPNFEEVVREYLRKLGYKVTRGTKWSKEHNEHIKGAPDFHVTSPNESFFVEVKSEGDALSISQIKWALSHREKIIVVVPSQSLPKHWKEELPIFFNEHNKDSVEKLHTIKKRLFREIEQLKNERNKLEKGKIKLQNEIKGLFGIHGRWKYDVDEISEIMEKIRRLIIESAFDYDVLLKPKYRKRK